MMSKQWIQGYHIFRHRYFLTFPFDILWISGLGSIIFLEAHQAVMNDHINQPFLLSP